MKENRTTKLLLLVIAFSLAVIALRPYIAPATAQAQSEAPYPFYIEPGAQMLRAPDGSKQVLGRVVIDMRTGKVWGFPTNSQDTYPSNPMTTKIETSHPFELGRFAFEDTLK